MKESKGISRTGMGIIAIFGAMFLSFAPTCLAQEAGGKEAKFDDLSLQYRTALHSDPLVNQPLEKLVDLYVAAGRSDELIALYRNHLAQYPEDMGSATVLIRILRRIERSGVDELIATLVPQHPNYAPLQYVLFRFYEERGDSRAPEALSRAIELETDLERRSAWLAELLNLSEGETARKLALEHFTTLLSLPNLNLSSLLTIARLAQRHRFWEQSRLALEKAIALTPPPPADSMIEIDMLLATALKELNRKEEAAGVLDALLPRLAPKQWQRKEILAMRLGTLVSDAERDAYLNRLAEVVKAQPTNDIAAINWAEALVASDRQSEAANVLVDASVRIPHSAALEEGALQLLENSGDYDRLITYLSDRLETNPDRVDLRFRLVKAEYAMKRDKSAEQDFRAVIAGLPLEEVSERILELQRYLKGIDRPNAAAAYLLQYVRANPGRLSVARELAEVQIAKHDEEALNELVKILKPEEAKSEEVLDLADLLLKAGYAIPARSLVEAQLAANPTGFSVGLKLIEILGVIGDAADAKERISALREIVEAPADYSKWLQAAMTAHRHLETLPSFLEDELSRYTFDEGQWSERKVERFLILCEAARRDLAADRLIEEVRKQLNPPKEQSKLDPALRLRLRKILVAVLETDPGSISEVVEQLKQLAIDDPSQRSVYDLQLALVYHRSGRHDLASPLLATVDYAKIKTSSLLRDAADALVNYGLLGEADAALDVVTKLEPQDFLSWERRISVLAALGEESVLRSVIRVLENGDKTLQLRERSRQALRDHLEASYWRSISQALETSSPEDVLPLLAAMDQEELGLRAKMWSEWTRSRVLSRLGREMEARQAGVRLTNLAQKGDGKLLSFPDGLDLALPQALRAWTEDAAKNSLLTTEGSLDQLVANPALRWIFELPAGVQLERVLASGTHALILSDTGTLYGLDLSSGKLLWRSPLALSPGSAETGLLTRPHAFEDVPLPPPLEKAMAEDVMAARTPPSIAIEDDRFFSVVDEQCAARSLANGGILWSTPLPDAIIHREKKTGEGAQPAISLRVDSGKVVLFDPVSGEMMGLEAQNGKLLWTKRSQDTVVRGNEKELIEASLNTGLATGGSLGLSYGRDATVFDIASGQPIWHLRKSKLSRFPILLRAPRDGETEEDAKVSEQIANEGEDQLFETTSLGDALHPEVQKNFLTRPSLILGSAVYWAEDRLQNKQPAYAQIDSQYLWLMRQSKVFRISTDLPIASKELSASGTLIGSWGMHLWFLDHGDLYHADFQRGKTTKMSVSELGSPQSLYATLSAGQLLVRGNASYVLFNARTGELLMKGMLPERLISYLGDRLQKEKREEKPIFTWQGRIFPLPQGGFSPCLTTADIVERDSILATFGNRTVVCLAPAQKSDGASLPPQ